MNDSIIIELLQNTALLLAFAMLYENFWINDDGYKSIGKKILIGLILSGIGVVLMFTPWSWVPGIVFDTRSVMISISGLFFGPLPTIITMVITSAVRLLIGGDGQWMGIAVIISSGTIGLLWRQFRPGWKAKKPYLELLAMGIVVHITMSLCAFLLPEDQIFRTLRVIALPLVFIYSPATMLLGLIMLKQYRNTQNRLAQSKLDESERRFTQVLESGNILSLILDKDGNIIYCNAYLLQITGYVLEDVLGKSWFEVFIPDDIRDEILKIFTDSIHANNVVKNYENVIRSKSGDQLQISWYNTVFSSDKNVISGVASIGVDITKRIEYERRLVEAKDKAEESERLKTAFLANMSHEIRTPMNGIMGFANLLKKPDLIADKQAQYIDVIEKSGKRMLKIIDDLIDISKIEAGIINVSREIFSINEIFDYLFVFFKPDIQGRGIEFYCKTPVQSEEVIIYTDREKFESILANLLRNAVKFTTSGSIEFGYAIKENELEAYVKDTGIGIPADKQNIVFDRFMQADVEDKMARQGAGLGLAISKAYVELLGGKIRIDKKFKGGALFYFTIPYDPDLNMRNSLEEAGGDPTGMDAKHNLNILIVEDDHTSVLLLESAVEDFCSKLFKARTGVEAVEIARDNPDIDLILMDIKLPVMDGYEATRQIRRFNEGVIIIAQTAYSLQGDREKSLAAGCNNYISKPISGNKLSELINLYFNR